MAKNYKTIALTGTEQKVVLAGQNCDIRNDSVDIVYASAEAGITSGADGVLSIPAGQAAKLLDCRGTLHLLGTGSVMLCGNDYSELVFKSAASASGGGGVDQGARDTINAHAINEEIHLTAEKAIEAAATVISNDNLADNPDFAVNQRGLTEYISTRDDGYADRVCTFDRWYSWLRINRSVKLNDGFITLDSGGNATCDLRQTRAMSRSFVGKQVTLSVCYRTSEDTDNLVFLRKMYDDGTGLNLTAKNYPISEDWTVVSITATIPEDAAKLEYGLWGTKFDVKWIKLELGSVATPFTPPDPATELLKCQRYYYKNDGLVLFTARDSMVPYQHSWSLPVVMRVNPTITVYDREGTAGYASQRNDNTIKAKISTSISDKKHFIFWSTDSELVANKEYVMSYEASAEL